MVMGYSTGITRNNTLVDGTRAKCMELEFINGMMEECILVNLIWTSNKDMVYSFGMTVPPILVTGKMDINMDIAFPYKQTTQTRRLTLKNVCGTKGSVFNRLNANNMKLKKLNKHTSK